MKRTAFLLLPLAVAGGGCSTDQVGRFVYSAFRVGNPAVEQSLPGSRLPSTPPPYEQYQQARRGDPSR
jgi:hypothetical protein